MKPFEAEFLFKFNSKILYCHALADLSKGDVRDLQYRVFNNDGTELIDWSAKDISALDALVETKVFEDYHNRYLSADARHQYI